MPNTSSTGSSGCSQVDRFSKHFEKCRNREGHLKASVFLLVYIKICLWLCFVDQTLFSHSISSQWHHIHTPLLHGGTMMNWSGVSNKHKHYGVRGNAFKLIQSHLSNRKQCVQGGNTKSPLKSIIFGIPQGLILGPLFFLSFINDLTKFNFYENYTFCWWYSFSSER